MSQSFFETMQTVSMVIAIVMLVVTIALFFLLKIYDAFMDLSGIKRKRGIKEIQEDSDYTTRLNKEKRAKNKKQKIMTTSGQINYQSAPRPATPPPPPPAMGNVEGTSVLNEAAATSQETDVLTSNGNETQVLAQEGNTNETQVLTSEGNANETQVLAPQGNANETQVLTSEGNANETQVLTPQGTINETQVLPQTPDNSFVIERRIIEIHTEEVMV